MTWHSWIAVAIIVTYHFVTEKFARTSAGRAQNSANLAKHGWLSFKTLATVPGIFAGIFVPLLGAYLPMGHHEFRASTHVFMFLGMVIATYFRMWAMRTLGDYFTMTLHTTDKQRIVSTGPYALVRHPGYAANLLLYMTGALPLSSNYLAIALTYVCIFAVWFFRIREEEAMLSRQFGDDWKAYCQRVPFRVCPRVW